MEKYRVVILKADDWEGLFVDGELISEDHHLGSGDLVFLLKKAEELKFKSSDIVVKYVTDNDYGYLEQSGNFPQLLSDLKDVYDEII